MVFSTQLNERDKRLFSKNWGWFFLWGLFLFLLGAAAIGLTTLSTLISVIVLGAVILAAGFFILIDSFTSWWGHWGSFLLHFITAILYIFVGGTLIHNPVLASVSLTLLLGVFYIIVGVFRIIYSLLLRAHHWGWSFLGGLISFALGILITVSWPASSLFIIGLFVGIDLLFAGWAYMMIALGTRTFKRAKG